MHTRIHNYGLRQCIHVFCHKLPVPQIDIKIKTVALFNHWSLQAEHGLKSPSNILTKHLTNQGEMWPKYLQLATLTYNMFNTPNVVTYSPYELVLGKKLKSHLNLESTSNI